MFPYLALMTSATRSIVSRSDDELRAALDHHRVLGVVGGDDAARVGREVARLARAAAAAEPQRLAVPRAPDRHRVRAAVGPQARQPVVVRAGQALLRPRPRQQPGPLVRPAGRRSPACTDGSRAASAWRRLSRAAGDGAACDAVAREGATCRTDAPSGCARRAGAGWPLSYVQGLPQACASWTGSG